MMFLNKYYIAPLILAVSLFMTSCESEDPPNPGSKVVPSGSPVYFNWVLLNDTFQEEPLILIGSVKGQFIIAYHSILNENILNFHLTSEPLPAIMEDDAGNVWDIFGTAIAGPLEGEQLSAPDQFNGFWFAWGTFFPDLEIYSQPSSIEQPERIYSEGDWLIPTSGIRDGGPGKDGIPSLTNPEFQSPSRIDFLQDDDLILGIRTEGEIRGYPHAILDWHEIINEDIGDQRIAITYCPLTGTGIAWDRKINAQIYSFGVSGLLYEANLLPYDRETDSHWSQIRMECVHGDLKGEKIKSLPVIEMNWITWKMMFTDSKIVTSNTGYERNYGIYPYGQYKTSNNLIFPVGIVDERLHKKEIVHGIVINDKAKVYRFSDFDME
jgi:hypothetical protein